MDAAIEGGDECGAFDVFAVLRAVDCVDLVAIGHREFEDLLTLFLTHHSDRSSVLFSRARVEVHWIDALLSIAAVSDEDMLG